LTSTVSGAGGGGDALVQAVARRRDANRTARDMAWV
jgi:hypothetical protein